MSRPTQFKIDNTLHWEIRLFTSSGTLINADFNPSLSCYKNGVDQGSVGNVAKRSSTVGTYDCDYDPAGEVDGDMFTITESSVVGGTTYENSWECMAVGGVFTDANASGIASGVWDQFTVHNDASGTFGELVQFIYDQARIAARNTQD